MNKHAFLVLLLLLPLVSAFSQITHETASREIHSRMIQTGYNVTYAEILNKTWNFMEAQDPVSRAYLEDTICDPAFSSMVESSILQGSYTVRYACSVTTPPTELNFSKQKYDSIIEGAVILLETTGNTTALNASNETPVILPEPTPVVSDTPTTLEEQYVNRLRDQLIEAKIQISVLANLSTYGCKYTSERKRLYYEKWETLTETARSCLPMFLKTPEVDLMEFSKSCPAFAGDTNTMIGLANNAIDQYVKRDFAEVKIKTNMITVAANEEDGTPAYTAPQRKTFYAPHNIEQGCIIEFEEWNANEKTAEQNGFNNGLTATMVTVFFLGAIFVVWLNWN